MAEALRIGKQRMNTEPEQHMIFHANPVARGNEQFWRVEGTSMLAGGWVADVDARTGKILRTRHLPGR